MSDVEKKLKALGVGRFQVMALLQAARYYKLLGNLEKAKSFGLNRAIFYAWAKYYGPRERRIQLAIEEELRKLLKNVQGTTKCPEGYIEVLGECVRTSPRGFFEIGGVEQTPLEYDQQVTWKIRPLVDPERAWMAALSYVSRFPEWVLRDPQKFYKYVYEPVRDAFFKELAEKGYVEPPSSILERLHALEQVVEKARKAQRTLIDFSARGHE